MLKQFNAPHLRSDFILVVNYECPELAATALSYLFTADSYLPIFSYQNVGVLSDSVVNEDDVFAIQRRRAEHFSVFLNNAIIENGGCENVVFLGLTVEQKSYLTFSKHYNVLDIENLEHIPAYLGGFGFDKGVTLECSIDQIGDGLVQALVENRILSLGANNPELQVIEPQHPCGVVFIETIEKSDLITAINYACAIGARCVFIQQMLAQEDEDALCLLERWQAGDNVAQACLKEMINSRIGHVDLNIYDFATFFTKGLPYILSATEIPSSMVNLEYRPDFFIFNAIVSEKFEAIGSAVVFSPSLFKDEETDILVGLLEFRNFYQRKLIGNDATSYNLKITVEGYPFDLLHICSHGGDVGGTDCLVRFRDRKGVDHTIEFDHVLSIALTPYVDMHSVESYYYFKKLDGLAWRSDQLKSLNYPHELYASLLTEINNAFDRKKVVNRGKVVRVANTNSISCASPWNYKATFDQVGMTKIHPLIFNNSCWSWKTVSTNFLVGGSRGYIGTLMGIGNNEAVQFAEIFYENVFNNNVINAFHIANTDFLISNEHSIYIFWGLHFSTLKNIRPVENNKINVLKKLGASLGAWKRKLENGEGSKKLLQARVGDINWLVRDVVGTDSGHTPRC